MKFYCSMEKVFIKYNKIGYGSSVDILKQLFDFFENDTVENLVEV